jgi:hypothetical protein
MVLIWVVTPCGLVGGYQEKRIASIFRVETSYKTMRRYNPEDHHWDLDIWTHLREKFDLCAFLTQNA